MARFVQQLLLFLIIELLFFIDSTMEDRSMSDISVLGREFVPIDSSLPPLLTFTAKKLLYCSLECNKRIDCRIFDFDENSGECRLWDTDTTTGSIVASPSKPQSHVGTIQLSPSIYVNIHNQSCDKCVESRYEICDINSNTCQCPLKTFWNGSMCQARLLKNQICSQADVCRTDLNLTCAPSCDFTYRCSLLPAGGIGQTVAGCCNGTIGNDSRELQGPWGIYVSPFDGTLYITDWDMGRYQAFAPFSRTGYTFIPIGINQAMDIFVDKSGSVYMSAYGTSSGTVYVQTGMDLRSFPPLGQSTSSCLVDGIFTAYGIAVDQSGHIYISLTYCYMVVKWALNATSGTLVAGQPGIQGSTSDKFSNLRFIYFDENRNFLYIADYGNNRVQKITIGGNGTGVTVAGSSIRGTGLDQLNNPAGIWVTQDGQTLYIADNSNHRVMKWRIGATQGSVVAGSASGVSGNTDALLNQPGDVALDPTETYLYVSDYGNHRIQRFFIK